MRVFISGPITGVEKAKSNFDAAARKIMKAGLTPVNPYYIGWTLTDGSHAEYMMLTLKVLELCDAVFMLDGWENSRGAREEKRFARLHGMPIYTGQEAIWKKE